MPNVMILINSPICFAMNFCSVSMNMLQIEQAIDTMIIGVYGFRLSKSLVRTF